MDGESLVNRDSSLRTITCQEEEDEEEEEAEDMYSIVALTVTISTSCKFEFFVICRNVLHKIPIDNNNAIILSDSIPRICFISVLKVEYLFTFCCLFS